MLQPGPADQLVLRLQAERTTERETGSRGTYIGPVRGPNGVKINQDDLRPFHDPAPKWILGHSSYLTYGKLRLGLHAAGVPGELRLQQRGVQPGHLLGSHPRLAVQPARVGAETGFTKPQYLSDYYVEKASFLRMDNITLGYAFKYRGQPLRLFGTVQNAFTITGYSGVDPTAGLERHRQQHLSALAHVHRRPEPPVLDAAMASDHIREGTET